MVAVQNLKGEIHLQVVYYNCVKFHKNSISNLVGEKGGMYLVSATTTKRLIGIL
jgi:hypothetical protein